MPKQGLLTSINQFLCKILLGKNGKIFCLGTEHLSGKESLWTQPQFFAYLTTFTCNDFFRRVFCLFVCFVLLLSH